jgi:hypothetical protein
VGIAQNLARDLAQYLALRSRVQFGGVSAVLCRLGSIGRG